MDHPQSLTQSYPLTSGKKSAWRNMLDISGIPLRDSISWGFILCGILLIFFMASPVLALIYRAILANPLTHIGDPSVVETIILSLTTSFGATFIAFALGTPLAYMLARWDVPLRSWWNMITDLPIILPPSVAGLALLMVFGRQGVIGQYLSDFGLTIPFTTAAVLIAQLFVAAPFFTRQARVGFAEIDQQIEEAARTEGANEILLFWRIMMPVNKKAIISGVVLCWTRALGEFGATLMFAGNLKGVTQTIPLALYVGMERDLNIALVLAGVLITISILVLGTVTFLDKRLS